jgi:isopentenyl-diphosphate delta-isomerase
LILVDDHDHEIGTATREQCHRGPGLRHRAFVLLIDNGRDDVLLQWRCPGKLGGGRWDVSATSHVRRGESYDTAIARCVRYELGIVEPVVWNRLLSYVYTERLGDWSENEFCWLFAGRYGGAMQPNYAELGELKWVRRADLPAAIRADPVQYTAWLKEAVTHLAI